MTLALVSFAAGVLLLQVQPALPDAAWAWCAPFCLALGFFRRILIALAAGFCWALFLAHHQLADRLAPELEGRDIEVVGVVAGLPALLERGVRFEFEPEHASERLPGKILVSWYRSPLQEERAAALAGAVHPGERWRFTVR